MYARISAIIAVLLGIWVFGTTLTHSVFYSPSESEAIPRAGNDAVRNGIAYGQVRDETYEDGSISDTIMPGRLVIPKLGIDSKIEYVGLTKSGNMGTPMSFANVAWYKHGTIPGRQGSAVLAGHVDNGLSLPGVFKNLGRLVPGDEIEIVRKDQSMVRFIVTDVAAFPNAEFPTEEIFNQSDGSYLRLITCTGKWDRGAQTYEDRLVVTAMKR